MKKIIDKIMYRLGYVDKKTAACMPPIVLDRDTPAVAVFNEKIVVPDAISALYIFPGHYNYNEMPRKNGAAATSMRKKS
ncbi:hypothetical protein LWM68_40840 [Niabella sp. W65]|nr:hypothetical protein [Niabella sp. W65]MCH7368520.1 hypothetical protein [Niabella sp. W65]ULT44111.1 hypothetical protein KRR40_12545 [Niabella sp. I65]